MSNEFGYIYVLTNPSMPGLVKVGKTTTTPNQRMNELHSTGVPTPFELECSISIKNCHVAERAAHKVLNYCRESNNREFFRISAKHAIEKILEVVDECEIVDFRESHGVQKIEEEVRRRRKIKEDAENKNKLEDEKIRQEQDALTKNKQRLLLKKLRDLQLRKKELGVKPIKKEPASWSLLAICYLPFPIGFLFWLGMLSIFSKHDAALGFICMALVVAGYFANNYRNEIDERYNVLSKPFNEIESDIFEVERELKETGYRASSSNNEIPQYREGSKLKFKLNNDLISTDARGFEKPARKIGRAE